MLTRTGLFVNNTGPYDFIMETDREVIELSTWETQYKVDPAWYTIDRRGHFHAYDTTSHSLPTLKAVTEHAPECDPDGIEARTHHECILCGETVEPNYIIDNAPSTVEGPTITNITVPYYRGSIALQERVSFYTLDYFGTARVTHITWSTGSEGINVTVEMIADFLAKKGTPVDL